MNRLLEKDIQNLKILLHEKDNRFSEFERIINQVTKL